MDFLELIEVILIYLFAMPVSGLMIIVILMGIYQLLGWIGSKLHYLDQFKGTKLEPLIFILTPYLVGAIAFFLIPLLF
jgi:hypothetical protein